MDLHDFVPTYKIFLWEAKDEKKRSGSIFHFNTHFSFFLSFNWFFSYTRKIDHSHLPDLIVDKFELTSKYAILGEPYKINIRFKEYPRLTKSPWIEVVRENTFAPALLRSTRKFSIPPQWKSSSPEITINYDAEQLIDIAVQQKKKLTIALDTDSDITEKNEGNNIITHDCGLYPADTKMADLMFYDHYIKNWLLEVNITLNLKVLIPKRGYTSR